MEAGHYARMRALIPALICILMVQKKFILMAIREDPPAIVSGDHMERSILQPEFQPLQMAKVLNPPALFSIFLRNGRAAVAKPVALCLCFFQAFETAQVLSGNAFENAAVRKMHNFSV
jgi:hypothetical protein